MALLRERVQYYIPLQTQLIQELEYMLKETLNHLYQQRIFRAVTRAAEHALRQQKLIHVRKFSWLNLQRNNVPPNCSSGTEKFVLNWSSLCPFLDRRSIAEEGFESCGVISWFKSEHDKCC